MRQFLARQILSFLSVFLVLFIVWSLGGNLPASGKGAPVRLEPYYREIYLDLVARAYEADPALDLRGTLGPGWTREQLDAEIGRMVTTSNDPAQVARLNRLWTSIREFYVADPPTATLAERLLEDDSTKVLLFSLGGLTAFLVVGWLSVAFFYEIQKALRAAKWRQGRVVGAPGAGETATYKTKVQPAVWSGEQDLPLMQYQTTFSANDLHYDPSFSIELPNYQFLGEFGVSPVQATQQNGRLLVPAFDLWIFDKTDGKTATHTISSSYAHAKNPLTVAQSGETIVLETKSLRLRARIVDRSFLEDPQYSRRFFENLTLGIAVWRK